MSASILNQARGLYRTIKQLQANVLADSARHRPGVEKDLTIAQLTTLLAVRDAAEITIKDLAIATSVSSPSASTMVDRLVDVGVLSREAGKSDRREVRVKLTSRGEELVTAMESEVLDSLSRLLEMLGPELAEQWCVLYSRIQKVLDAEKGDESMLLKGVASQ